MLSQAGTTLASPADRTLSQVESMISQAGSTQSPQAGNSQTSTADSTLSLAESGISQAGSSQSSPDNTPPKAESVVLPQAVRCSARLRASQASNNSQAGNSSRQAGNTPRVDSAVFQLDSNVSQVASSQAGASQEARSPPNRLNTPRVLPPWRNLTQSG